MLFVKNLTIFLLGLGFQVLAGVFPQYGGAFIGPASLLLSAADVKPVLDGSFLKHVIVLVLGMGCQIGAVVLPSLMGWKDTGPPLLAAGGILIAASDIRRVLKGQEQPPAPMVTPEAVAAKDGAGGE